MQEAPQVSFMSVPNQRLDGVMVASSTYDLANYRFKRATIILHVRSFIHGILTLVFLMMTLQL